MPVPSLISRLPPVVAGLLLVVATPVEGAEGAPGGASKPKPSTLKQPSLDLQDQYKRVHQYALKLVLQDRLEQADQFLDKAEQARPGDPETEFCRVLLRIRQGRLEEALQHAANALELGLPSGRIAAGPRQLLGALAVAARLGPQRLHGPMVGHVTASTAFVWVRTARSTPVRVVYTEAERETEREWRRSASVRTTSETDFTAVVRLTGLQPSTIYRYRVVLGDAANDSPRRAGVPRWWSFRTAPATGTAQQFRLVFGGGAGYVPANERVWQTIRSQRPDLMLLLGDNIYSDDPETAAIQQYCYYRRQSRPEFRRLVGRTPVYAIWDDHDFGTNDCWGGPDRDQPEWKLPVWRVFRQNWANPYYGGGQEHPGVYFHFSRGDVDFLLLDGRFYRTSPKQPEPTMLGPVQKEWLKTRLRESQATFKVLCSPVPWSLGTKGNSLDTWNGFREEREEIFSFLAAQRIDGVVLLSADRHRSDAWRIERPAGYDLYEFNSSRLTNQHVHPEMGRAIFSYNKKQSFGVVDFDTTAADPSVSYRVMTIDGEAVHTHHLKLSQISGPR